MSEDMPWVIGLTDEEVQELRKNKQELTQYGKEKIRKLMNKEPTHEEMIEEATKREAENKAFEALDNLYKENDDALKRLAEIECNEAIVAKVSEEDYQKVMDAAARREAINKETLESMGIDYENFGQKPWDESMLEETEKREAIVAKVSEEDYHKVMDAAARQELAKKPFKDLTEQERIQLALEELAAIVMGGQDGQEFYNSVKFIKKVLESFR